ncbi:MAG: phosphoribosyltransferase family protein [Patescibacteria group bacterium]|jgi:adenine phosphoribosyltransferase
MPEIVRHQNEIVQIKSFPKEVIEQKLSRINRSFIGVPIELIKFRDGRIYPYSPFKATADVPFKASFFEDAADIVINSDTESFEKADIILSEADRGGGPFAEEIGRKTGLDIALANWHKEIPEDDKDTIIIKTDVGYSGEGYIVVRGIKKGQKVIIVDDLLSTGGTAKALIKAVENVGATVIKAFFIGEKVDQNGRYRLAHSFPDLQVTTLTRFNANPRSKYTTDAAFEELISGWNPFDDDLETAHEIANFENSLYDNAMENILKDFKRRILSKISHKESEKIKNKAREEMERIIMNIKSEYNRKKQLEQDMQVQRRVKELQSQIMS